MKRHSDRKAHFERRQQNNLQWSGRVGDRDRAAAAAATAATATAGDAASQQQQAGRDIDSSDPGTPSMATPSSAAASPVPQQKTVRNLVRGAASDDGPVPVGEHHQGSFGVYMAHKMDKLRHQVDGAVRRLEGMLLCCRCPGCGCSKGMLPLL